MRAWLGLGVLLLFAGCVEGPVPEPGPTDALATPPALPTLGAIFGSDCEGLVSIAKWPLLTAPGTAPPQWEPGIRESTQVQTQWDLCRRVRVGPFERPLAILIEGHDRIRAPEGCKGTSSHVYVLHRLWLNDTQVADWLATTYRMPVAAGPIEHRARPTAGGLEEHEWRWKVENATKTSSVSIHSSGTVGANQSHDRRLAWTNGSGISYVDVKETYRISVSPGIVSGTMEPPMLYASARPNPYVAQGDRHVDVAFEAKVHEFRDFACTRPF